MCGIFVVQNDPESRVVSFIVAGANRAGELGEFEAGAAQEFGKDAAGVIDEVAKPLRDENGVNVARSGLFELMEIVIGQRLFERDFDSGRRLVVVGCDSNGHGAYGFTLRGLFRIGAAGENGEGAVELLGKYDACELVRKRHGT